MPLTCICDVIFLIIHLIGEAVFKQIFKNFNKSFKNLIVLFFHLLESSRGPRVSPQELRVSDGSAEDSNPVPRFFN